MQAVTLAVAGWFSVNRAYEPCDSDSSSGSMPDLVDDSDVSSVSTADTVTLLVDVRDWWYGTTFGSGSSRAPLASAFALP